VPGIDARFAAIAPLSWELEGVAATVTLGPHLLDADSAGERGPMTAAVVALGAGGSVTASGGLSVLGLRGAMACLAVEIAPVGASVVGALLLFWFLLRSL
jgi:hypothetical protein